MGGASQVAMRVASQIWQIVFASQTLQVFRLALRKKAQYVVVQQEKKQFNKSIEAQQEKKQLNKRKGK
jgi:hypothetical protein